MVNRERFEVEVHAAGGGVRLIALESCGSTNDECAKLAQEGAAEGLVVIAGTQTAGRGRFDRTWVSPPGGNLYMSVLIRPEPSATSHQPSAISLQLAALTSLPPDWCALGLLASLSVLDAVEDALADAAPDIPHPASCIPPVDSGSHPSSFILHPSVLLKWPNDLLIGNRKLCGILSTAGTDVRGEPYAVVGIGVNINAAPSGLDGSAATLAELAGHEIDLTGFAAGVAAGFLTRHGEARARGFDGQFREWERRSGWIGRQVTVSIGRPGHTPATISGTAAGLGEGGGLRLRLPDGRIEEIFAGDASLKVG
jgi:BirA family biotin operon repressor/biotin-[acetyl-CoA-carboxylase] ligase